MNMSDEFTRIQQDPEWHARYGPVQPSELPGFLRRLAGVLGSEDYPDEPMPSDDEDLICWFGEAFGHIGLGDLTEISHTTEPDEEGLVALIRLAHVAQDAEVLSVGSWLSLQASIGVPMPHDLAANRIIAACEALADRAAGFLDVEPLDLPPAARERLVDVDRLLEAALAITRPAAA